MDELLTPPEVARRLRVKVPCLRQGKLRRTLPWLRINGRLRLPAMALEQFLDACLEPHRGPTVHRMVPHDR